MGMPAGRINDLCTGHECYPPRPCISGSSNVIINGRQSMPVGSSFAVHCCDNCHDGRLSSGSSSVMINGVPAGRIGDRVNCGSNVMTGSTNVIIGG